MTESSDSILAPRLTQLQDDSVQLYAFNMAVLKA